MTRGIPSWKLSPTTMVVSRCAVRFFLIFALSILSIASSEQQEIYGTQCSFAITGETLDGCDPAMLDERQKFYNNYMKGCHHRFSYQDCQEGEEQRHAMNQRQPQSMVNMTSTGYMKLRAPDRLIRLLNVFWNDNKDQKVLEDWGDGSIYTNHWESPTYMVNVEDDNMSGGGKKLKDAIWDAAIDGIAQWTGGVAKLRPVSLYGIREYTEGSVLSPHVDRIPLVSSGIVNVAQDVDEPWPLEVYDRNGHAENITMEPGDMILYESHSLIHGRPFPLKGRYYANVFIHFEPFDGWQAARSETHLVDSDGDLPPYILPGSPEERYFRRENPNGWSKFFAEGDEPPIHSYAQDGLLDELKEVGKLDPRILWYEDENGWTPLHEAVRGGHFEVVKYLVETGADINGLTHSDISPLQISIEHNGRNHEISKYLLGLGAEIPDEDEDEEHHDEGDHDEHDEDDDYEHDHEEDNDQTDDDEEDDDYDNVPSIVMIEEEIEAALERTPEIVPAIVVDDDEEL